GAWRWRSRSSGGCRRCRCGRRCEVKAQCEKCKEIVPLVFGADEGGIRVSCPSCEAEYKVPFTSASTSTTASEPPVAPSEMTCPKCGEGQKKAAACRRCGLVIAKWRGGERPDSDGLFAACLEQWDDAARHDAFVAQSIGRSAVASRAGCA